MKVKRICAGQEVVKDETPRLGLVDLKRRRTNYSGRHLGTSISARIYREIDHVDQVKVIVDQVKRRY